MFSVQVDMMTAVVLFTLQSFYGHLDFVRDFPDEPVTDLLEQEITISAGPYANLHLAPDR